MSQTKSWSEFLSTTSVSKADPEKDLARKLFALYCGVTAINYIMTCVIYTWQGRSFLGSAAAWHLLVTLGCLWLAKINWNFWWVAQFRFTYAWCVFFYNSYKFGGVSAPPLKWIAFLPVFWWFVLGKRAAFFWSLAFTVLYLILYFAQPPGSHPSTDLNHLWTGLCTLFTGFIAVLYMDAVQKSLYEVMYRQKENIAHLLRVLCHDMRSPMQTISFVADLLGGKSPDLEKSRERLKRSIDSLRSMVDHSSEYLMAQSSALSLHTRPVDVIPMLRDLIDFFDPQSSVKRISVHFKSRGHGPFLVNGDEDRLKWQVLGNILSNAVKFSWNGGRIVVSVRRCRENTVITISDNGIGIPESIREKLFEVALQRSRRGTAGEPGAGFGLPIAATYLSQMGGSMKVRSREDRTGGVHGTVVRVCLPSLTAALSASETKKPDEITRPLSLSVH